jgi:hypothetical protein
MVVTTIDGIITKKERRLLDDELAAGKVTPGVVRKIGYGEKASFALYPVLWRLSSSF